MSQQSNPATLREALTKLVANWRAEHGRYPIKGCGSCADELEEALAASGTEAAPVHMRCPKCGQDVFLHGETCPAAPGTAEQLAVALDSADEVTEQLNRVFAPAAASPEATPSETAWLIERDDQQWAFITDDRRVGWSSDSLKALRFARKEDGEVIASFLDLYITQWAVKVTEHTWS